MASEQPQRTLRQWRVDVLYMTQVELAAKIGVHPGTVAAWESGSRKPGLKHRRLIAELVGVRPQEIDWETPSRERETPAA